MTVNKLASIQLGDKVAYRDPMGREHVGVVSELVARGVVMVRVADQFGKQRITARNFVRIEARSERSVPEREES